LFCHAYHRADLVQVRHGRTPFSSVSLFDWIAVVRVSSEDYVDDCATRLDLVAQAVPPLPHYRFFRFPIVPTHRLGRMTEV